MKGDEGLSVATPVKWRGSVDLHDRYDDLVFDRTLPADQAMNRLLGVGHPLIDRAITACREQETFLAHVKGLDGPMVVATVEDEITGTSETVHRIILGVGQKADGSLVVLQDWEALQILNDVRPTKGPSGVLTVEETTALQCLTSSFDSMVSGLAPPFRRPKITPLLALLRAE